MCPIDHKIMKTFFLFILSNILITSFLIAQDLTITDQQKQEIRSLVDKYTQARDRQDASLLESILTTDIDQLVSSGTWRKGKEESMKGMMQSSQSNEGKRTITVESVRLLTTECAIADARYEIENADGTSRKMWSTFIAVSDNNTWKIAAIRNMLPAQR